MSTFGTLFRVTTYGESHCRAVGCTIDGCPPGLPLDEKDIQVQLTRRRPGQSSLTTPRDEKDRVSILSGTEFGVTLGSPIALTVPNEDHRPKDYSEMDVYPRPSHADWTYIQKYGVKSRSGGGRASARETIGRVAAGAVAEKYLKLACTVEIVAFVSSVGEVAMPFVLEERRGVPASFLDMLSKLTRADVDADETRCPHKETADRMRQRILAARDAADSIGGTVTCVIRNVPVGLGEPCFDKMQATLAHAMMSIPATKGFEIGSGFAGTKVQGHLHNDMWVSKANAEGKTVLGTVTNNSGGVQGGITNGENIYFRVAFKPPATIGMEQRTATYDGVDGVLAAKGRHDPCVVPRAVPIVEAMAALVIMDSFLAQQARSSASSLLPKPQVHCSTVGRPPQ